MRVLVTGSHGFIASAAIPELERRGHGVWRLVRGEARGEHEIAWQPDRGAIDTTSLTGFDAVVHLAGEPLTGFRWTARKKARITSSRVHATRLLVEALASVEPKPSVLVSASAAGYYGNRRNETLREEAPPGQGFLAETVQAWEAEVARAATLGIRDVRLRFGMVIGSRGGAIAVFARPARFGLATVFGSGGQTVSWIALSDAARAIAHAVETPALRGPANAASPNPVSHEELIATLTKVLRRPHFLRLPAFAVRLAFGQMGIETLLFSQRLDPSALTASGFTFDHPALEAALRHELGRPLPSR